MTLRLVIRFDGRSLRFPIQDGELILGSAPECDVQVNHFTISRRHARLRRLDGAIEVEDLESTNGTFVAGQRLSEPYLLPPGIAVTFGGVDAELEQVADADLEAAVTVEPRTKRPPAQRVTSEGDTPPTASLEAVKQFTLVHLPELLQKLARGATPEEMAQVVAHAIFESVPCLSIEVLASETAGEGVVFTAARSSIATTTTPPFELDVVGQPLKVRIAFASVAQERGYAALVHACTTLISLAGPPTDPQHRPAIPTEIPALPEPATLTPTVHQIYADAARVAQGEIGVLIRGDSGTGKEVLARYIHTASPRCNGPFVPLNCAALPRDLLEAELFGIERGTATGVDPRPGKFELADGGTLFLDEIGDMALETQAKILRVLHEGEVYRIGARQPRPARVRILSATNQDLHTMLNTGSFRSDLYHRIADWEVKLPPLSERPADIPNLAAHFLAREARRRSLSSVGISRAAMAALQAYHWPGNIRQLEREMARAALFLEDGQLVERSLLMEPIRTAPAGRPPATLTAIIESAERRAIQTAIERAEGNISKAASDLGIGRSTIYRRMAALGLESDL